MEYRDLYDANRVFTGKTISKHETVPQGFYYTTVMVFIQNDRGEILLQKRSVEKGGQWATTGGHPKAGETSVVGMQSEIKEELGIDVEPAELTLYDTIMTEDDFVDFYYLKKNIDLQDIKIQKEEVQDVAWFTIAEIETMIRQGDFFKYHIDAYKKFLKKIKEDVWKQN